MIIILINKIKSAIKRGFGATNNIEHGEAHCFHTSI